MHFKDNQMPDDRVGGNRMQQYTPLIYKLIYKVLKNYL
jgi:hypothetical protein